ncbi:hypothetical protein LTR08_004702 [Meristemomyces frigidus]|nr:hypothetical protein LTR08_004702 [Meristemomyces frigidus]
MSTKTVQRNNETGLSDSTVGSSSSSSSAERYRLDEQDSQPILLYSYRGKLQTSSQQNLCAKLDKDEKLRCTKKLIPRGTSHVEIKRHDLYLPDEKELFSQYPNYDSSLASIKVPSLPYWSRLFFGNYDELYIVSPESSPNSSVAGGSRHASPTSTWAQDNQEDAGLGAANENDNDL